jgi:hypothetical protein
MQAEMAVTLQLHCIPQYLVRASSPWGIFDARPLFSIIWWVLQVEKLLLGVKFGADFRGLFTSVSSETELFRPVF